MAETNSEPQKKNWFLETLWVISGIIIIICVCYTGLDLGSGLFGTNACNCSHPAPGSPAPMSKLAPGEYSVIGSHGPYKVLVNEEGIPFLIWDDNKVEYKVLYDPWQHPRKEIPKKVEKPKKQESELKDSSLPKGENPAHFK